MKYLEYMAAAYTLIWAAILVYFILISRKEREIWAELSTLREALDRRRSSKSEQTRAI